MADVELNWPRAQPAPARNRKPSLDVCLLISQPESVEVCFVTAGIGGFGSNGVKLRARPTRLLGVYPTLTSGQVADAESGRRRLISQLRRTFLLLGVFIVTFV